MDIVNRLRNGTGDDPENHWLLIEAANEIERLREALRDVIPYVDTCNAEHRDAQERAKAALKEGE